MRKGTTPNPKHVGDCFIAIRDELLLPNTDEIVDHIRDALVHQHAVADALTDRLLGGSRRPPLPEPSLQEMVGMLARDLPAEVVVAFGRLVKAGRCIGP